MIPTRPLILGVGDTTIGLIYLTSDPLRTSSRAYSVLKTWAPISAWGTVLMGIGTVLLAAVVVRAHVDPNRSSLVMSLAAGLGAMWCAAWASQLAVTAHADKHVNYAGSAVWLFLGVLPHLFLAFGREG
jgi:hypothetical protein